MTGEGGYSSIYEAAKNKFLTEIVKTEPLSPPGNHRVSGRLVHRRKEHVRARHEPHEHAHGKPSDVSEWHEGVELLSAERHVVSGWV